MSIPGNANPLLLATAAAAAGDVAAKSLRFNSGDSAYLQRTPSSAGNRKTFTFSAWVKKTSTGSTYAMLGTGTDTLNLDAFDFRQEGLRYTRSTSGSFLDVQTNAVFRDPSAWYHVVLAVDTTQSTASNRVKIYVNGVQQTSLSASNYPSQNEDTFINSTEPQVIGRRSAHQDNYFDGYMADAYLIDGSQLDPTSFGAFDDNGVWQAAAYSGTFGTNGFHLLDFENESTVGNDSSGNNNDFTANNISTTAGAGNDVLFDVPTNGTQSDTGAGGEVSGNYCTWNPLDQSGITFSNGNLDTTGTGMCKATFGLASGKWYWEQTVITKSDGANNPRSGVATANASLTNDLGAAANQWVMFMAGGSNGGKGYNNSTITGSGSAFAVNDVAMFAYDADAEKLWFGRNGTWITGDPAAGTTPFYSSVTAPVFPVVQQGSSSTVSNWGQRAFAYSAPSGYKALCTTNLPTPTIADGSAYFEAKLYTGNGGTNTITGLEFSPDWTWIKKRNLNSSHSLHDTVRGATKRLRTESTDAETTETTALTAFTSDGFTLGSGGTANGNNDSFVSWNWDAGSSTVSNTDGSITSSIRASQTAGFSIVKFTGTGSAGTVGHGLNADVGMVITKTRESSNGWIVWHKSLSSSTNNYLQLNLTDAVGTLSNYWGSGGVTSSVFGLGTYTGNNTSGEGMIAYCISPVAGYSAVGSYTGNGSSTDGPFVHTGFRPALIILKPSSRTGNWTLIDTTRNTYNVADSRLHSNLNDAEATSSTVDILSNGFKIYRAGATENSSNQTYIWAAWAENPFQANGGLAR